MLIRTQHKIALVNLEQVKEIATFGTIVKCEFVDGTGKILGMYSTEERAIKELDGIERMYFNAGEITYQMQEDN